MGDCYIGEIRMFAGTFAPNGWALCDGQLLPIAQYTALFALIGTTYGGNGQTTFALPDLRGRVPLHANTVGTLGGQETQTLTAAHLPSHTHSLPATTAPALGDSPTGNRFAGGFAYGPGSGDVSMSPTFVGPAGSNLPFSVMQPSLGINFIIALEGIFPPQS
jgi:microcystin-dependent protein